MRIVRALSLLFLVAVFSLAISNQELLVQHLETVNLAADASDALSQMMEPETNVTTPGKPTFMQVEKINHHELPTQARIGYLLSRGF